MRKTLFAWAFVLTMTGMIAGCASQPDTEDDVLGIQKSLMEQKEEFKTVLQGQLREIDGQIVQAEILLAAKGDTLGKDARKEYEQGIADLKDFRKMVESKLDELDNVPDNEFEQFRQNFNSWFEEFKTDFKKFGEATKELFRRSEPVNAAE